MYQQEIDELKTILQESADCDLAKKLKHYLNKKEMRELIIHGSSAARIALHFAHHIPADATPQDIETVTNRLRSNKYYYEKLKEVCTYKEKRVCTYKKAVMQKNGKKREKQGKYCTYLQCQLISVHRILLLRTKYNFK